MLFLSFILINKTLKQIYPIFILFEHKLFYELQMGFYARFLQLKQKFIQNLNLSFHFKMIEKILLITVVLALYVNSAVIPFDKSAVQQVFKNKKPALMLFTNGNDASSSAQQAFTAYEASSPESFVVTQSDKNDGHGFFDRLVEYLGVKVQNVPTIMILNEKGEKYLFESQEITQDSISSFVDRVKAGTVSRFLKSAEPPIESTGHVKVLVGKTFEELVLNTDKQVLVKFYAPWCGHCKTLAPHYDEAAERLSNNPNILIANFDSTQNEVAGVQITGFPTLKFWGKDKTKPPMKYDGQRTADGIIEWLKEHTEYEWVEQDTAAGQEL